jgi:hypothetical protein
MTWKGGVSPRRLMISQPAALATAAKRSSGSTATATSAQRSSGRSYPGCDKASAQRAHARHGVRVQGSKHKALVGVNIQFASMILGVEALVGADITRLIDQALVDQKAAP